jgi:hypothetical protein
MGFLAEMVTDSAGVAVILVLIAWAFLSGPKPIGRRCHAVTAPAVPDLEPRIPRDTSRPYPRPKGHRSKLNRVCPVCGTGKETGGLDKRLLGWPVHGSCAEWAGGWEPPSAVVPPASASRPVKGGYSPPARAYGLSNVPNAPAGPGSVAAPSGTTALAAMAKFVETGMASIDEMRDQILGAFSVPPADLGTARSQAGDRLPLCPEGGRATGAGSGRITIREQGEGGRPDYRWRCTCGGTAYGSAATAEEANGCALEELEAHQQSGWCCDRC